MPHYSVCVHVCARTRLCVCEYVWVCVSMCECTCVYVCVRLCGSAVCVYADLSISISISISLSLSLSISLSLSLFLSISISISLSLYLSLALSLSVSYGAQIQKVYMYAYVYMYECIHTHTCTQDTCLYAHAHTCVYLWCSVHDSHDCICVVICIIHLYLTYVHTCTCSAFLLCRGHVQLHVVSHTFVHSVHIIPRICCGIPRWRKNHYIFAAERRQRISIQHVFESFSLRWSFTFVSSILSEWQMVMEQVTGYSGTIIVTHWMPPGNAHFYSELMLQSASKKLIIQPQLL